MVSYQYQYQYQYMVCDQNLRETGTDGRTSYPDECTTAERESILNPCNGIEKLRIFLLAKPNYVKGVKCGAYNDLSH